MLYFRFKSKTKYICKLQQSACEVGHIPLRNTKNNVLKEGGDGISGKKPFQKT